jgi:hypothetical protein
MEGVHVLFFTCYRPRRGLIYMWMATMMAEMVVVVVVAGSG